MISGEEENNGLETIIYLGTHKIVAFKLQLEGREPRVLHYVTQKDPEGFDQGLVTNLHKAAMTFQNLFRELNAKDNARSEINPCYVVLGNSKLKTYSYTSSVYYQGFQRSITPQEMRQVVRQTRSVATLPLTEFVLQAIPETYIVNDTEGVKNPLGLEAHRLGVHLKLYTMNFQDFKNIAKALESADIEVNAFFPKSVAISEAVLTEQEKSEGVMLIDIADEVTHLALWKDGVLLGTRTLAAGGAAFTAAIACEWKIEAHDARKLKEKYGSFEAALFGDELIPIVERSSDGPHQVKHQEFQSKLIEQGRKWLGSILDEADAFVQSHQVRHPHYVYTGGGAAIQGFLEFLQKYFSRSGRIGLTRQVDAPNELLVDPSVTGALGIARWLQTYERDQRQHFAPKGFIQKTLASAKDWFSSYF